MNNESVEMDIREEYIKALTTAISDISAIQDKKFWTEMLTKEIIKETVSNIINYYKEYSLNSGLMKFINGCAADMDYSQIEVDFGAEITRQFLTRLLYVMKWKPVNTGRFCAILDIIMKLTMRKILPMIRWKC